jgi:hypothetical protein
MVKAKMPKFNVKIGFMNQESNEPIWIIERVASLNQIVGTLPQVVMQCLASRGYVLYKDDNNVHYNISEI